jgi:hypothetical protein
MEQKYLQTGEIVMKYPFEKKSFWIIFSVLSLPFLTVYAIKLEEGARWVAYIIGELLSLLAFLAAIFLFDYLGHLIFSKPETKNCSLATKEKVGNNGKMA